MSDRSTQDQKECKVAKGLKLFSQGNGVIIWEGSARNNDRGRGDCIKIAAISASC